MSVRSLPALAHALGVAPDLDSALVALGEALADGDRTAQLGVLRYDGRREMIRERLTPTGGRVIRAPVDTTFDHLPATVRSLVSGGGQFVDLGDRSAEFARLFGVGVAADGSVLSLRGLKIDGQLAAVLALLEQRRMFGPRTVERFAPAVALFELAFARFSEREARDEAVRTLEDVTQRVHGDYVRKLAALETQLGQAQVEARQAGSPDAVARVVKLERELAQSGEAARRSERRAQAVEQQVGAAVGQLEQAHIELHRRSESLRQKTRTLYLIERVLRLDTAEPDPRRLVDGLLALVGDDMQAQRCSLMLRAPEEDTLYLAASRGLAPNVVEGTRISVGTGVAGRVAATREPLLVQDVAEAQAHPLLRDQYLTTGSFISFPLVYRGELVGVVNLTNRAQRGVFLEEDVERVKLLALVVSLVASHARLSERLLATIGVA